MDASRRVKTIFGTNPTPFSQFTSAEWTDIIFRILRTNDLGLIRGFVPTEALLGEIDIPSHGITGNVRFVRTIHCKKLCHAYTWDTATPLAERERHDTIIYVNRSSDLVLWDGYCKLEDGRRIYRSLDFSNLDRENLTSILKTKGDALFVQLMYGIERGIRQSIELSQQQLRALTSSHERVTNIGQRMRLFFNSRNDPQEA